MVFFGLLTSPGLLLRDLCVDEIFDIFLVLVDVLLCAARTLYVCFVNLDRLPLLWHIQVLYLIPGWSRLAIMTSRLIPDSWIVHRVDDRLSIRALRCLRLYALSNSNFQSLIFSLYCRLRLQLWSLILLF